MAETPSKDERLKEFFQRLASLQPASTFEEAYLQLCKTLDQVEDEMSGLPNEPERWMTLDRMFPPQPDRMSSVAGCDVKRFDNLRHITYISGNGAIEIRSKRLKGKTADTHLSKIAADGRSVIESCPSLAQKNL
jgi:hypothetical protein